MRKLLRRFADVPVGSIFLTSSETLPEDELYEKSGRHEAHQLSMPEFNRVGGTWRFMDHHVVTLLQSEYSLTQTSSR